MPPASQTKLLFLLSAAIVVIGIATGVRVERAMQQAPAPSIIVMPADRSAAKPVAIAPLSDEVVPAQYVPAVIPPVPAPVTTHDQITARAYVVGNALTGHVYISSHDKMVLPVASMSKLITTLTATDTMSPTTTVTITPEETDVPPDGSDLRVGETFILSELLYPMLLDSSNVAAEAIASSSDRAKFLYLMSSYAWEIGMPTAFFADPSGLSPENVASADDMLALARYLYTYRPDILALTRTPHLVLATTTDHGSHEVDSIHPFVSDPRFIGGKTGRTPEAGETMMTILRIGSQPIVFVVMGSDYGMRQADTDLLIQRFEDLKSRD